MCGFAGFSSQTQKNPSLIDAMLSPIHARGPDDTGAGQSADRTVTLGHKRLSILDLSIAGAQPMVSHSGRYVIAYNGEIYNFQELKNALPQQPQWRGHSDTEIILACIEAYGIEAAIKMFEGMFAFALYDEKEGLLHLARDPAGIKPLYYGHVGDDLIFGSQLHSFLAYPGFQRKINPQAMALYFKYNSVPAPYAIYENCAKVKAGTFLTFKDGQQIGETTYWSMPVAFEQGLDAPFADKNDAHAQVERILTTSVKDHLIADVPVGVFLSGGVDSSLITALAKPHIQNLKSFAIGFDEPRYNEAPYASEVAKILGTEHHERIIRVDEARDLIPDMARIYDEPFADASSIPTTLLARFAKEHVKVALSGDGGDELFGGYSRYVDMMRLKKIQKFIPNLLLNPPDVVKKIVGPRTAFKLHIANLCLQHANIEDQYDALYNFWPMLSGKAPIVRPLKVDAHQSDLSYMCMHDAGLYMPDDILTKVDRATMSASLEARVPFLTHNVIEMACRIPSAWHSDGKSTKLFLKQILGHHLPPDLINRPKKGFALPIDIWLRGPLKDWAYSLLEDIRKDGFLPMAEITKVMDEHQKGLVDWQYALWNILMWQSWKNEVGAYYS